jgi:hypothetical protein
MLTDGYATFPYFQVFEPPPPSYCPMVNHTWTLTMLQNAEYNLAKYQQIPEPLAI